MLWHCWFGHLACKNRPRNDLLCVEWDVRPTHSLVNVDCLVMHPVASVCVSMCVFVCLSCSGSKALTYKLRFLYSSTSTEYPGQVHIKATGHCSKQRVGLSYLCSNFWRSWPETSLLVRGYTAQLQNTKVKFVCLCQRHRLKVTVTGAKQSEANWPYLDFFLDENADYSCLNRSRKRDTCFTLSVLS